MFSTDKNPFSTDKNLQVNVHVLVRSPLSLCSLFSVLILSFVLIRLLSVSANCASLYGFPFSKSITEPPVNCFVVFSHFHTNLIIVSVSFGNGKTCYFFSIAVLMISIISFVNN